MSLDYSNQSDDSQSIKLKNAIRKVANLPPIPITKPLKKEN